VVDLRTTFLVPSKYVRCGSFDKVCFVDYHCVELKKMNALLCLIGLMSLLTLSCAPAAVAVVRNKP
jgi:hypothetical protein